MANYNLRDRNAGSGTSAFPVYGVSSDVGKCRAAKRGAAKVSCRTSI